MMNHIQTTRRTSAMMIALLALLLAGCGSSFSGGDTPPPEEDKTPSPISENNECDNGAVNFPTCNAFNTCGTTPHGQNQQRTRYEAGQVPFGGECLSEIQTRICNNGVFTAWNGDFTFTTCRVLPNPDIDFDTVLNDRDNCPTASNRNQSDINHDGTGDVCDPYFTAQLSVILDD